MGSVCCSDIDSVEHVKDIHDFLYVLTKDREFFQYQLEVIEKDKNIEIDSQENKKNCLIFIINKYIEYEKHLKLNHHFYSNIDLIEMKIQYKKLTKNIHILKKDLIHESFKEFDSFILFEN